MTTASCKSSSSFVQNLVVFLILGLASYAVVQSASHLRWGNSAAARVADMIYGPSEKELQALFQKEYLDSNPDRAGLKITSFKKEVGEKTGPDNAFYEARFTAVLESDKEFYVAHYRFGYTGIQTEPCGICEKVTVSDRVIAQGYYELQKRADTGWERHQVPGYDYNGRTNLTVAPR